MEDHEKQYLKIYCEVGLPEILTAVAEEAAEVAQAALKLRRAINQNSGNPTPLDLKNAVDSFQEELGDFTCCVNAAAINPIFDMKNVYRTEKHKRLRWLTRIYEEKHKRKMEQEMISENPAVFYQTKEYPVTFKPAQMEDLMKGDLK